MLPEVKFIEPQCFEEFLSCSVWWNPYASAIGPGFSRNRAGELHRAGIRFMRDIWHPSEVCFLRADEVSAQFGLRPEEIGAWYAVLAAFATQWPSLMQGPPDRAKEYDWVGIFHDSDSKLPVCVVPCTGGFTLPLRPHGAEFHIPFSRACFTVQPRSRHLIRIAGADRAVTSAIDPGGNGPASVFQGRSHRVRVVDIERGQPKVKHLLYYGRVDRLTFDLDRIMWHDEFSFMSYTTKEGRAILRRHQQIPDLSRKWTGILLAHHNFRWTTVWTHDRTKKEEGLIWLTWNRAVAMNDWRGRLNGTINRNCPVCDTGANESVLHRFWECPRLRKPGCGLHMF